MQYKVDMPYPEIKVEKKDVEIAKEIFNAYAGEVSEDSAIHTYIFQMLLMNHQKEYKEILKGIAITEMHHLEILGLLIKELGFTPIYVSVLNNKTKWFSGEYINYSKEWKKMLLDNIKYEKQAILNYEKIITKTTDENIKHILKRIILDERLHIEIFQKLYGQAK